MQLYYAPGTISVATAITLHEADIAFDPIKVDFASGEQRTDAYHLINPKGRVPVLVTPHGLLTETGAILDYLAALAPDAALVPTDPFAVARMHEVMYYLASTAHVNHAHKMRGHRWADAQSSWDDMTAKVAENMTKNAAYIETHCLKGPFVLGETFSLADPYLYVVGSWLAGDKVDLAQFPKITAFMDLMSTRPSVQWVKSFGMLP